MTDNNRANPANRHKQAAQRALQEAKIRREKMNAAPELAKEVGGRRSAEPTRYGDWERKGITSDF